MFKKVRIIDSGASLFLEDEVVEKRVVDLENARLKELGKPLIQYEPIIQGITKAAVNTGRFISAASFQLCCIIPRNYKSTFKCCY